MADGDDELPLMLLLLVDGGDETPLMLLLLVLDFIIEVFFFTFLYLLYLLYFSIDALLRLFSFGSSIFCDNYPSY